MSENVHCDELHGPTDGEQFQMALLPKARYIYRTFTAILDCQVNVAGHVWPADLMSHSVVHVTLAGVSAQFRIMHQVEEA